MARHFAVHSFTQPGDAVILMTPVYHAFARVISASGREVLECPLVLEDGTTPWTSTPGKTS
jgi:cysteine-S-conjugate beta-lyase